MSRTSPSATLPPEPLTAAGTSPSATLPPEPLTAAGTRPRLRPTRRTSDEQEDQEVAGAEDRQPRQPLASRLAHRRQAPLLRRPRPGRQGRRLALQEGPAGADGRCALQRGGS